MSKALMIQGTSSHAGKSLIVTALCYILSKKGYKVAPFKAQNMSLNSYVTINGEEIARAQALQALACNIEPSAYMNPILLKPKGNGEVQVVLKGKLYKDLNYKDYYSSFVFKEGLEAIKESLENLKRNFDIIIVEGAGSPAEINLYEFDITNMKVAELLNCPVIIVGDIDRGGVFASLYGTFSLLKEEHKALVKGFIINKLRGDKSLLDLGIKRLEEITSRKVIGVIPFIEDLLLPSEDSLSLENYNYEPSKINIGIIRFPRISNFTDFDPLNYSSVRIFYISNPNLLERFDIIILPGTKNTIQDLLWLKERGIFDSLLNLRKKLPIIGICGGYQILGKKIFDLKGIEGGKKGTYDALGFLEAKTSFDSFEKVTKRVKGRVIAEEEILRDALGFEVQGYEIHKGIIDRGGDKPLVEVYEENGKLVEKRLEGSISEDGLVLGTQIHGLFDVPFVRNSILRFLAKRKGVDLEEMKESISNLWLKEIDKLSRIVEKNLDLSLIYSWIL